MLAKEHSVVAVCKALGLVFGNEILEDETECSE